MTSPSGEGRETGSLRTRLRKPSPAMIVALAALFFAMSGLGIAARDMITGKQIENGTITSKDLANGAVKARNLDAGSVTATALDPDYSPPESLRGGTADAFQICPNGVIVPYPYSCPSIPDSNSRRYAKTENFADFSPLSIPGQDGCGFAQPIPLSSISFYPDLQPIPGLPNSADHLEVRTKPNMTTFTATARAEWEAGSGTIRAITIIKEFGSGPNEGETVPLATAFDVPSADTRITQFASADFTANNVDKISFQAIQCGPAAVDLERLDVSVVPQASQDPPATE